MQPEQDKGIQLSTVLTSVGKTIVDSPKAIKAQRMDQLETLQDWCLSRISYLSLEHSIEDATALTAEHLESLRILDQGTTLWMRTEASDHNQR